MHMPRCCMRLQMQRRDDVKLHAQVLHVAVLRHHHELVEALLDFGFPVGIRNERRWMPLDEAVSARDRRMVKLLHVADVTAMKAANRAKRGDLLTSMRDMPDYTFKVGLLPDLALFMCSITHFWLCVLPLL